MCVTILVLIPISKKIKKSLSFTLDFKIGEIKGSAHGVPRIKVILDVFCALLGRNS